MRESVWVKILRSTPELESLAEPWRTLFKADNRATPFQHPEWLLPWWRHFNEGELRTVVLLRGNVVVGLLPMYRYADPAGERKLLPLGIGTSEYLNGLFHADLSPDEIRAGLLAAFEQLSTEADWDALYFPQLRPESPLAGLLPRLFGATSFPGDACSKMPALPLSQLPTSIRRNVLYNRNRATRRGSLVLNLARPGTQHNGFDLASAFDNLVRLHTERWQQLRQPGVLADTRVLAWHRQALPGLFEAGIVRLHVLTLDGDVLGVLYSLVDPPERPERTQYIYIPGFATDYADLRPGSLMTGLAIDSAAREGIVTIDMLRGDEAYKHLWKTVPTSMCGFRVPNCFGRARAA